MSHDKLFEVIADADRWLSTADSTDGHVRADYYAKFLDGPVREAANWARERVAYCSHEALKIRSGGSLAIVNGAVTLTRYETEERVLREVLARLEGSEQQPESTS